MAFQQLAAQSVNGFALLVHHVVVFEQVFAGLEVLRFDGLLGRLDALGDDPRLDGDAFLHAELFHEFRDPIAREDAQQVVLKGKIKARGARVALAAGAPAQLVVDAPRFVAFRPQDVQAAEPHHLLVLHVRDGAETRDELLPVLPPARVLLGDAGPARRLLDRHLPVQARTRERRVFDGGFERLDELHKRVHSASGGGCLLNMSSAESTSPGGERSSHTTGSAGRSRRPASGMSLQVARASSRGWRRTPP